MTVQLKLDASALRALFPEGSEARVILARCVVEEIVKSLKGKNITSVSADVLAEMKPQLEEMKAAMINHVGTLVTGGHWNRALTDDAKKMIQNSAMNFIDGQLRDLALSAAENYISDKGSVESRIEYIVSEKMKLTDHYIEQHVDRLVLAKLESALRSISIASLTASNA